MPSLFITGVSSGIGNDILRYASDARWKVTAVVRNDTQKKKLEKEFPSGTFLVAELQKRTQVDALAKRCEKMKFDYVVLNAGYADVGRFDELPTASYEDILETNLITIMRLTHALLARSGKIIFTSSLVARFPGKMYTAYAVAKAAVSHFYASLATEYPEKRFLCVEIGGVGTPFHKKANIGISGRWIKPQARIARRYFHAIQHKTGVVTLAPDWWLARKVLMAFEDVVVWVLRR